MSRRSHELFPRKATAAIVELWPRIASLLAALIGSAALLAWLMPQTLQDVTPLWIALHPIVAASFIIVGAALWRLRDRRVSDALHQSEAWLQAAQDRANIGSWEMDTETDRLTWSPQMFRLLRRDPKLGEPTFAGFTELVHPDDRAHVAACVGQAANGMRTTAEFRSAPAAGPVRYFDAVIERLDGSSAGHARLGGTMLDITAHKEATRRIAHLNRVYAVLSDINHTVVRVREPREMLERACRIAVERGGFRLAWIGLIDPATKRIEAVARAGAADDYVDHVISLLNDHSSRQGPNATALETGRHVILNDVEKDATGLVLREAALRLGFRSIAGFPLVIEDRVRGIFGLYANERDFFDEEEVRLLDELAMDLSFALDVAERDQARRHAHEMLQANEERFRLLIENAQDIISVLDERGAITFHSPSTARVLGYDLRATIGRNVIEFVHPDDVQRAQDALRDLLTTRGRSARLEFRVRHADGSWRILEAIGQRIEDAAGRPLVILNSRDITERRVLEDQLRQAQKMEAIGTLAGGIAHDFNNILAAISGYTELAKMTPSPADEQAHLNAVLKATGRASDLVRQIMAFSRQQEQERRPMQLARVVNEALGLLRATIPATIEFGGHIAREAWTVLADPTQIHQVVMNLCTNAWHAIGDTTGRIEVRLQNIQVDEQFAARHSELRPGSYVCLSVADTGCGMSPETMRRIYEPFFTTKEPGKGTGLGLSVVHGIITSHDGAIVTRSQLGKGTTFDLYFPALANHAAESEQENTSQPQGTGERILIVDDEELLAQMGAKLLSHLGYRAQAMTRPADALNLVRADPQAFDLVITDLAMPGMSGTDLAHEIHRLRPDLPIVLTTGFTATLTEERLREAGVREVLPKPPTARGLTDVVRRALSKT